MKKRLALILLFIMLLPLAIAIDETNIIFTSPDKQDFTNYYLTLNFADAQYTELLSSSQAKIPLLNKEQSLQVTLDLLETPAIDYYGSGKYKDNFLVFPVGYVQGTVVDNAGNLVSNAELSFNCYSSFTVDFPDSSDNLGFFNIPKTPIGECIVIASKDGVVGKQNFEIKLGEISSVEVSLAGNMDNKNSSHLIWLIVILISLILIGLLIWYLLKNDIINFKKKKPLTKEKVEENSKDIEETSENNISKKTTAILETLNDKEKKVVNFLLENNYQQSQSKIRHATKIPRTSLSRVLQSLERKKIISIKKEGKLVDISLTSFFLDD
jgi:uncharacterized membrane protein